MKSSPKKSAGVEPPAAAPLAPACAMFIFGAAGDLTKRLVAPAFYNLVSAKRLPNEFQIVGVDLASKTTEEWPAGLMAQTSSECIGIWMILHIKPSEGIRMEFAAKRPGRVVKLSNVTMDFAYEDYFKTAPNTGYNLPHGQI